MISTLNLNQSLPLRSAFLFQLRSFSKPIALRAPPPDNVPNANSSADGIGIYWLRIDTHATNTYNCAVPTVFESLKGYRFFFFSLDRGEPMHRHVAKGRGYAKFWLQPLELAKSRNLRGHELNEIARLIEEHREEIEGKWNSHFSR